MLFQLIQSLSKPDREIISQRAGSLRIAVYYLNEENFEANPAEICFYGIEYGHVFAFQTIDYQGEDPCLMIDAIRWYAEFQGYRLLEIFSDPEKYVAW